MNRSPEEIEREVEATREDLDRTVEALKEKMTPRNLKDEFMRGTGAGQMMTNVKTQVQDNRVPLALIGAGMLWILFNNRQRHNGGAVYYETRTFGPESAMNSDLAGFEAEYDESYSASAYTGGSAKRGIGDRLRGLTDRARGGVSSARERVSTGASSAGGTVKNGAGRVGEAARDGVNRAGQALSSARTSVASGATAARERAANTAAAARERAVQYGERGQQMFRDQMDAEPLVIGAIGVAVGAALGAAFPATPVENRYIGRHRDRLLHEGRSRAEQGIQQARQVASAAYDSVREEFQRQDFKGEAGTIKEKVREVARAGVDTARSEMESGRGVQ